jgi:hypothetical protein
MRTSFLGRFLLRGLFGPICIDVVQEGKTMNRFLKNRLWISLLALVLCLGTLSVATHSVHAAGAPSVGDENNGGGSSNGSGDPDAPGGSSVRRTNRGGLVIAPGSAVTVGDGAELQSVWMGRLNLVLQAWQVTFFHL